MHDHGGGNQEDHQEQGTQVPHAPSRTISAPATISSPVPNTAAGANDEGTPREAVYWAIIFVWARCPNPDTKNNTANKMRPTSTTKSTSTLISTSSRRPFASDLALAGAALMVFALFSWAGPDLGLTLTDPLFDLG